MAFPTDRQGSTLVQKPKDDMDTDIFNTKEEYGAVPLDDPTKPHDLCPTQDATTTSNGSKPTLGVNDYFVDINGDDLR